MNKVLVGVVSFVVASAAVRGAAADVLGPPRTDCVPGTIVRQTHGMGYCEPNSCTTAAECAPPATCLPQGLCVIAVQTVEGNCDANGRCASGTCQTLRVCIAGSGGAGGSGGRGGARPAGAAGTGAADTEEWLSGRACTCRTPARDPSRGGLVLALVVCLGSLRRCRRSPCRG
jgi:hypothetical protein